MYTANRVQVTDSAISINCIITSLFNSLKSYYISIGQNPICSMAFRHNHFHRRRCRAVLNRVFFLIFVTEMSRTLWNSLSMDYLTLVYFPTILNSFLKRERLHRKGITRMT